MRTGRPHARADCPEGRNLRPAHSKEEERLTLLFSLDGVSPKQ
jgi:hypothetical protein